MLDNLKLHTELFITIPVTIISIIFTILNAWITIYLVRCFKSHNEECKINNHSNSNLDSDEQHEKIRISPYFQYTASITVIFATLNSLFNTISCFYLVLDPHFDDNGLYIYHPSHIHRIISTVCWYIAQVALIYLFSGRLYFCFGGSIYGINKNFFIYINIFNTIIVVIGLISGYYGVFMGNKILAEIGLNLIGRILYEIISYIILYLFSKRLLLLSIQNETMNMNRKSSKNKVETPTSISTTKTAVEIVRKSSVKNNDTEIEVKESLKITDQHFLAITARNAVLMFSVSFTVFLVIFCFFGWRFIFGTQTRLTLLIPMNMASFDSLNTCICILCSFRFGEGLYHKLYGQCDIGCKRMCHKIAISNL